MSVPNADFEAAEHARPHRPRSIVAILCLLLATASASLLSTRAQEAPAAPARPDEMALVFSLGYAGDQLPQDPATFDRVMQTVAEAGYNTVLASHEPWRLPIMEKHGLKLMVDLLDARHHVYKNLEGAEALATSLRDDDRIWGYHLFSDTASNIVPGRQRDIDNVRSWDPTHPTFVGTQQHVKSTLRQMTSPDVVAYYDYHWTRDRGTHFPNLDFFSTYADEKDAQLYRWIQVDPGRAGIGNPNRIRFTVFSSMAHGLKGVMWFLGTRLIDTGSWQWNQLGLDVAGVNQDALPLAQVFAPLRHLATWSTPTTINANDDARDPEAPPIAPGLKPIPEDFWAQVESGEVMLGHFRDPADPSAEGQAGSYLFVANHNSYQPQPLVLAFAPEIAKVEIFDRDAEAWTVMDMSDGRVDYALGPGYGELLRVSREPDLPPVVAQPIADLRVEPNAAPVVIDLADVFTDPDDDDAAIEKALAANSNTDLVTPVIVGDRLTLVFSPNLEGVAEIVIRASSDGQTVEDAFQVVVLESSAPPTATPTPTPTSESIYLPVAWRDA